MSHIVEYENLRKVNAKLFDSYKSSFESFLQGGWYVLGDGVSSFEGEFASYVGASHCVGVASGLDALVLAIDALDLPLGSHIIVPSNSYIATILAIVRNGFVPILVEPDIKTYNIDPSKIEQAITPQTRAIIVVHLYGKVCQMDQIEEIAKEYDLAIIEDTAQAHGAKFNDKMAGSFGVGCFSFYPTKNLGAMGDGGAVVCSDEKLASKIKTLRNYGSSQKYHNDLLGYNSRLDEIQARFLSIKLKVLDEINEHKRELARVYFENLDDGFVVPHRSDECFDVYHIYNVRVDKRDELRVYLRENDISSEVHYPIAPHRQKALRGILDGKEYPISQEIHDTTLSLPISYANSRDDVLKVCEVANRWIKNRNTKALK
ncbi:MAG: DegT/DnrJ/EryC1/StrS family aminotransferase [Sulfuricurvum sp.]|jgi:dTDP-4-amino-4,6-dideoxygalactose transaminase